jgi:hypothetical protein
MAYAGASDLVLVLVSRIRDWISTEWAQLRRFHLKMKLESSLQKQDDG